ncbi:MAG: tryptophan synthase subunit alpha [Elusimicrobia bacterium]|nr:tryptophan synthase subunit alpha [Elusimicrobiota bacterium]
MNRLEKKIRDLKKQKRKALITFITAGFPDFKTTETLIKVLESNGADIVELGVPFSDPIADGPTIQFASEHGVKKGVSLLRIFDFVKRLRKKTDIPILLMSYSNPIFHLGNTQSAKRANNAGVDGFIVPDLIPEESKELSLACRKNNLSLVFLAAPNTPDKRLKSIDNQSRGFVYIVSLTGVTGSRKELPQSAKEFLKKTNKYITRNSRFIGFGISSAKQVLNIKNYADGVIVGSALIEIIRKNKNMNKRNKIIASFIKSLRKALDS